MTVKQWLWRYQNADKNIDNLLRERHEVYERLTKITAALDGDGVSTTHDPHKFDEIIEIDNYIRQRIAKLISIRLETISVIDQLEDWRQRDILTYRYINGYKWDQIADAVYLDVRQVYRIHGNALQAIKNIINNNIN